MRETAKKKKGQLGLKVVYAAMVLLLILGAIAIALFVSLDSIVNSTTDLTLKTVSGQSFANETIVLNDTLDSPATVENLDTVSLSDIVVTNSSGGEIITATNYTVSTNTFILTQPSFYNNTNVNVSASYSHVVTGDAVHVQNNITNATVQFFNNIPTIFVLLGVVFIISAVLLIFIIVSRLSKEAGGL